MGPDREHVQPPSTEVRILRQTRPIERVQGQCGLVRIETWDTMQPHERKMPEMQGESYCNQRKVCKQNRSHHNGMTEQASATEGRRDKGGNGGQDSSVWHQVG